MATFKSKQHQGVTLDVKLQVVTPELARKYLDKNVRNYRGVKSGIVKAFARDFKAGCRHLTGNSIAFFNNGDLRDGQHRLHAVIESGVPVEFLIVRNLPEEGLESDDTGSKRKLHNHLGYLGYKNPTELAGAARQIRLLTLKPGKYSSSGGMALTVSEMTRFIEVHSGMEECVNIARRVRRLGYAFGLPYLAAFLYLANEADHDTFEDIQGMLLGESETVSTKDPFYKAGQCLANKLAKSGVTHIGPTWQLGLLLKSWNQKIAGRQCEVARFDPGTEEFPVMAGLDYTKFNSEE